MRSSVVLTTLAGLGLLVAGCGAPGSSGTDASTTPSAAETAVELAACEPVAGDALVVLADDLGLQTVDNIVPAVNVHTAVNRNPKPGEITKPAELSKATAIPIDWNKAKPTVP